MQGGDLVHEPARVGQTDELLGLGHGDRAAFAGTVEHVAHMAHEDAQALVQIARALAHQAAHAAALAGRDAQMAVVVLDVLAAALVVDLLRVGGDGALDRDDAHDARAHRGVRRVLDLAGGGVLVEGVGDLGMRQAELLVDEQELKNAGGVGRQEVDLQPDLGHHDLHDQTDVRDLVQHLAGALDAQSRLARNQRHKCRLHAGQRHHDGDLLVGDPLLEDAVLRAVGRDFIVPVVDLLAELDQILSNFQCLSSLSLKLEVFSGSLSFSLLWKPGKVNRFPRRGGEIVTGQRWK